MKKAQKVALPWALWPEDCMVGVPRRVKAGLPTLACLDVPYNLGQPYSDYVDNSTQDAYLGYIVPRIKRTVEYLHPHGSLWVAINDANVSELDVSLKGIGLYPRRKICWYFTFGQHNSKNFTQSHVTWLYYTKHRTECIFNADDPAVRIPSARQLVYKDKRANPKGRLPDDTWILRPQALDKGFQPYENCWYFSRVCGTFKAKIEASPNQIPVLMLDRIIRICSRPGDIVIDTFGGSMSCGEAAILAGRKFIGFDISKGVVAAGEARLVKAWANRVDAADSVQMQLFPEKAAKSKLARKVSA